ncbi:hypothetical protein Calkro_0347 [Caldicellulosiruptor kronotskyensis 2002]|uniref:Uncharacterized protein n=1 Tax=Caldicellulosiruptor kronotskyensis (strain DSM 18902 / VKM B-2412 / 2002) TaxID=632348 RepID=E4SDW3_CALK2|nr:DUF5320 family protein [Caldicellulosiruptor kronotskyensis]ADQ45250.1 hypothetical protein Calkro_0347 [Caldicellulosiruptor kronotskyensis 2002]
MPWGFGPGFGAGNAARGFGRGFGGGFGKGLGICKWVLLGSTSYAPNVKDALEFEKQVLEQRLKLIDKLLKYNEQKQE